MDLSEIVGAATGLRELVSGDGAALRLLRVDSRSAQVEFELDLSAAGCSDCVLPPAALLAMVDAALKRRVPGSYQVLVDDPRLAADAGNGPPAAGTHVTIVDPATEATEGNDDPGPEVGGLAGRTVGFRVDVLWRSWDHVVDEWCTALHAAGARTVVWRRTQGLAGEEGQQHHEDFAVFLASVDAVVSGLGNCGSCTSWTIKDAIAALETRVPTVAVTTEQFAQLGATLAGHYGRPGLKVHVLPYPLDTRPEEEVRQIAREHFPALLARLGAAPVPAGV